MVYNDGIFLFRNYKLLSFGEEAEEDEEGEDKFAQVWLFDKL